MTRYSRERQIDKKYYQAVHAWIRYRYGKASTCSFDPTHKSKRYDWANISGNYEKNISDYIQLCRSCHRKMDFKESSREHLRKINKGNKNGEKTAVIKLSKEGKFLKKYPSVAAASRDIGIPPASIFKVILGKTYYAAGFKWEIDQNAITKKSKLLPPPLLNKKQICELIKAKKQSTKFHWGAINFSRKWKVSIPTIMEAVRQNF